MADKFGFKTAQKDVATAGTPVQVTAAPVESAEPVTLKAKEGNVGKLYYGNSAEAADKDGSLHGSLDPDQAIDLPGITNLDEIWLDADNNGDGAEVIYS